MPERASSCSGDGIGEYRSVAASPCGPLILRDDGNSLIELDYGQADEAGPPASSLARTVMEALSVYFNGPHGVLEADALFRDLPLALHRGTSFQARVWERLRRIPPGQTISYGALARELKSSPRAIGQACRSNPIALIVPCHRVVAAHGLGGYGGWVQGPQWQRKQALLQHEGVNIHGS